MTVSPAAIACPPPKATSSGIACHSSRWPSKSSSRVAFRPSKIPRVMCGGGDGGGGDGGGGGGGDGGGGGLRGGVVSRERGSSKETLCGVTMLKYVSLSARWARAVREAWRAPPWHVEMRGIVVEVSFSYMRSCLFACSRRAGPRHVRVRSCVARYARRRTPPRTSACSAYHILSRAECVLVRLRRWACIRGCGCLIPLDVARC